MRQREREGEGEGEPSLLDEGEMEREDIQSPRAKDRTGSGKAASTGKEGCRQGAGRQAGA